MKYLKEGVTGKQYAKQQTALKSSIKKTQNSFSHLLKIALEDKNLTALLESLQITKEELTPRNLKPARMPRELTQKNECTAHMLTAQIKRYAYAQIDFADLPKTKRVGAYMEALIAKSEKAKAQRLAKKEAKVELKKVA